MKLVNAIEGSRTKFASVKKEDAFVYGITVMVIEDDYVNYLFLNEVLSKFKLGVFRALSLEEACLRKSFHKSIDLLIVNISLTCAAQISVIEYLREVYSVPVVVIGGGEKDDVRLQEVVDWADGIISLNADTEHIYETISDMLGISLSKPVFT